MTWTAWIVLAGIALWVFKLTLTLDSMVDYLKRSESTLVKIASTLESIEHHVSSTSDNTDVVAREVKRQRDSIFSE